jgi:hypothetical protein
MTQGSAGAISHGMNVLTSDGEKLGTVKEIADQAFEVNAHFQLDYWLPLVEVAEVQADGLVMAFPEEQVGLYKMGNATDIAGTAAAELDPPADRT